MLTVEFVFEALIVLDIRSGGILRIDLADLTVTTVYTDAGNACPDGVVIVGDRLYWTTMGTPSMRAGASGEAGLDYSAHNGGVHMVGLDGSGRGDVVPDGVVTTGKQIAFDGDKTLYWSDREGRRVSKVGLDGGPTVDVVVNDAAQGQQGECVGVTVDPGARLLYWTQKGPSKGGQGRIFRAGLDLPDGQDPAARTDIELLWDGLPEPIDVEVSGGYLYWTDRGAPPLGNTLNRAALPGPGQRGDRPEILASGFGEAIGLAVDDAAGVVYVTDLAGRIRRIGLGTGSDETLLELSTPLSGIAGLTRS